jgi:hypothetical protein
MPFFIFVVCLVTVNVWMTRRILRAGDRFDHKGLHITMVWIAPFIGALLTHGHVRPYERLNVTAPMASADGGDVEPPPQELSVPGTPTFPLAPNMEVVNGFPIMYWSAVADWLATIGDPDIRRQARLHGQRAWLMHMRDALGPHFSLHESENAFVLSSLESTVVAATAKYVTSARRKVASALGKLAEFAADEKSIMLVLDDEEWYYHYVAVYYPSEGEFAFSGGMFINAGCPHFVVRRADLASIEPVIVHELAHSAVSHLRLPLWLDEGIAVNTEHKIAGAGRGLYTPHEIRAKHLRFWGETEIQQFWSGEAFRRTDDGNMLSYDLARIMVEHMAKSWEPFERFVMNARREDAGAASAAEHLDVDLGAYVCALFDKAPAKTWSSRDRTSELSAVAEADSAAASSPPRPSGGPTVLWGT